mgnify:CR=1 FL=1|jgi:hypothetical protein
MKKLIYILFLLPLSLSAFPPVTHGVIASQINQWDVYAQKYIDSAGITNATEKTAISNCVKQLKDSALWNKLDAIYPFLGSTSASCKWNLKNPVNSNAAFRLTFSGGWTFSSTGALPNGVNAYANTYWNSVANAGTTNASMGVYLRTNTADGAKIDIGFLRSSPTAVSGITTRFGSEYYGAINTIGAGTITNTNTTGFFAVSTIVLDSIIMHRNGTNTKKNIPSTSNGNLNVFIGARNLDGAPVLYSDREHIIDFLGDGLTSAELIKLYNIFTTFKTAVGR